jgi:broad specificity phosphatase PhoE
VDALTSRFVGVDFSAVPPGPDALYTPHHREGKDAVRARARDFAAFLLTRPETTLAVVSHAGFLHFFAAELAAGLAPAPRAEAARWFDNAECRTMALVGGGVEVGGV